MKRYSRLNQFLFFLLFIFPLSLFDLLLQFLSHQLLISDLSVTIGSRHAGKISELVLVNEVEFIKLYLLFLRVQHFRDLV